MQTKKADKVEKITPMSRKSINKSSMSIDKFVPSRYNYFILNIKGGL